MEPKWEFTSGAPIYMQLMDKIKERIISGVWGAGERLPTVRELAAEAAVNPNTMQRALLELEDSGLLVTQRTVGRTVTEDASVINAVRQSVASHAAREYLIRMYSFGFDKDDAVKRISEAAGEDNISDQERG